MKIQFNIFAKSGQTKENVTLIPATCMNVAKTNAGFVALLVTFLFFCEVMLFLKKVEALLCERGVKNLTSHTKPELSAGRMPNSTM